MGLFYTAMERAEQAAPEAAPAGPEPSREQAMAAPAAAATPLTDWEQAARLDLAGFPLTASPAAAAPEVVRQVSLDAGKLGLIAPVAAEGEDLAGPLAAAREQFRILRTRVLAAMRAQGLRNLLITSAAAGEGKTMVAANLALQLSALREGRILLVDADLRRAGLTAGVAPAPGEGLADFLRGRARLQEVTYEVDRWLSILPGQAMAEQATELLAGQRMPLLLRQAQEEFDLVLLDGAPIGPVADSRVLAQLADASVLVARSGVTPSDGLAQVAALLRPGLLGTVLNGAAGLERQGYGYYAHRPTPAKNNRKKKRVRA
jgi:capsular exopolysaccharide synthesis family protein